jgi:putative FmdB family regulatory protein
LSPTRLFACMSCGHRFEVSRVVAESSLNMTLCPHCSGHEVETVGESNRESASRPVPAQAAATPSATVPAVPAQPAAEQPVGEDAA